MPTPRLTKIAVFSRLPVPAMTGNLRAASGPEARQDNLAAVRVAADDEGHGERRGFEQPGRSVSQQDRVR